MVPTDTLSHLGFPSSRVPDTTRGRRTLGERTVRRGGHDLSDAAEGPERGDWDRDLDPGGGEVTEGGGSV